MTEREMVEEFHRLVGAPVRRTPTMPSEEERVMRCTLLLEEVMELIHASGCVVRVTGILEGTLTGAVVEAMGEPDLAAMAQECADVRYIAHGTDLTMGAPPNVFAEVHRSNMAKRWPDGTVHRREDGKVVKPPGFVPADVAGVLARASRCPGCIMCSANEQQSCPGDVGDDALRNEPRKHQCEEECCLPK